MNIYRIISIVLVGLSIGVTVSAKPKPNKDVTIKRQIEPNYPNWAYTNGIGEGYAKIAFYVDEEGETSDYLALEYSHKPFADELLKIVLKWKFVPAHRKGVPIKSVCHAYWEFLPDLPIVTNAMFDVSKRIDGSDGNSFRTLKYYPEVELDFKPKMLNFPGVVVPPEYEVNDTENMQITVKCNFFVDTEGFAMLPTVLSSSDPYLDDAVAEAFQGAFFDAPVVDNERTVAWLEKTYTIPVVRLPVAD